MSEDEALRVLERMPEEEFKRFFDSIPERTKMLIRSGFADWRKVLPAFYVLDKGQTAAR